MISEFMIDIIFGILTALLSVLPDITWSVDVSSFTPFFQILNAVCYLLPMGAISSIVSMVIGLTVFRVVISIVKTIWSLLPVV